jgi:tetratricopeptide (TPR) repeat protein
MASSSVELRQSGSWLHEPFLIRASEPGTDLGRHALGAFLTLRLADRFRPDEDAHPLALAYQVRATRDYLLDLRPQNPEVSHLMEVVRLAEAVQQGGARTILEPPLLAYAFWLEEDLRLAEALDVVETALGLNDGTSPTEEIAALLQRARVLRLLGQMEDASTTYESARTRAMARGDMHSSLLARIGCAIVMRQVGNLPASETALREISKEAEESGDRDAMARANHDLGLVLVYRQRSAEGIGYLYRAFESYERAAHRLRALSDIGEALKREGGYVAARDAFAVVLRNNPPEDMRVCTMIALLELGAKMDDRLGFSRWKREITAMSANLPPERRADFELQVGLGCAGFGQARQAEQSLRKALALAEQHRLNEIAFSAEAALDALKKRAAPNVPDTSVLSGAERAEEFAEIAEKLHALRAS